MESPLTPPKSLLAVFDELIQARAEYLECSSSIRDNDSRDSVLDLLRRIENPSRNELNVLREISKSKEDKAAKLNAAETKLDRLCGKFHRECSKWLLGKLVHNSRHNHYMCVSSVTMEPSQGTTIVLHGPVLDDIRCEGGLVYTKKSEEEDILFAFGYIYDDDPRKQLSQMLERFSLCDIDDVKAAMDERKEAWAKHFDLMKAELDSYLSTPKQFQNYIAKADQEMHDICGLTSAHDTQAEDTETQVTPDL